MVRAGWYGREGQQRQRWWCHPKTGQPHRFTETLPRIVAQTGEEHACTACQTRLEPWEGLPAPRLYGFTAKDVAWALTQVAGGATYRSTGAAVRARAGRELSAQPTKSPTTGKTLPPANQHGQLVSDWVEVYAPVIWRHYATQAWSGAALLDEDTVKYSHPDAANGLLAFYVLAAVAYTPQGRPFVAAVEAVPKLSKTAWTRFLGTLPRQPEWVVTDGGASVIGGARKAWPDAEMWRCEWHLRRNLFDALPHHVRKDPDDALHPLLNKAQLTSANWETYLGALRTRARSDNDIAGALRVTARLGAVIAPQAGSRPDDLPVSTGPLEQFSHHIGGALGDRAAKMTNKPRADALLKLLAARRNGWADHDAWTAIVSRHLTERRGFAAQQRAHTDTRTKPSLR